MVRLGPITWKGDTGVHSVSCKKDSATIPDVYPDDKFFVLRLCVYGRLLHDLLAPGTADEVKRQIIECERENLEMVLRICNKPFFQRPFLLSNDAVDGRVLLREDAASNSRTCLPFELPF